MSNKQAIVVAPGFAPYELPTLAKRRLARGRVSRASRSVTILERVRNCLGLAQSRAGTAACRYLGETGRQPGGWIAAADPLLLEPMLDHVRVMAAERSADAGWLEHAFAALNDALGGDFAFECVGAHGYLLGPRMSGLPGFPASHIVGEELARWLPRPGESADLHRLISEVQMVLHSVNESQDSAAPANSLWIWGGGEMLADTSPLPRLYGSNAELLGYWRLHDAPIDGPSDRADAPVDLAEGLRRLSAGEAADSRASTAVIVADDESLMRVFNDPWRYLRRLKRLQFLLADGWAVTLCPSDRFRFWRGRVGFRE